MQSRKQVQETVEREAAKPVGLYPLQTSRVLPPSAAGKGAPEDGESSVSPICAAMIFTNFAWRLPLHSLSPSQNFRSTNISRLVVVVAFPNYPSISILTHIASVSSSSSSSSLSSLQFFFYGLFVCNFYLYGVIGFFCFFFFPSCRTSESRLSFWCLVLSFVGWGSKAFRVCFCFPFFISWVVFVGLGFGVGGKMIPCLACMGLGFMELEENGVGWEGGGFREVKRGFVQQQ